MIDVILVYPLGDAAGPSLHCHFETPSLVGVQATILNQEKTRRGRKGSEGS